MKSLKIINLIFLFTICQLVTGQKSASNWEKWRHLIGEWVGEGSGQPGQNQGTFSFQTDLDGKILVRKNHTVFPATADSPKKVHDDLLIVYPVAQSGLQEAIYFDNEGHTINYSIAYSDKSIVLTSEKAPNVPIFQLTYTLLENGTINTKFEMSQDGVKFMVYIEGKSKKQN